MSHRVLAALAVLVASSVLFAGCCCDCCGCGGGDDDDNGHYSTSSRSSSSGCGSSDEDDDDSGSGGCGMGGGSEPCYPSCDYRSCERCYDGECHYTCGSDEHCYEGQCVSTDRCVPPCNTNACQSCVNGHCEYVCSAGESCVGGECAYVQDVPEHDVSMLDAPVFDAEPAVCEAVCSGECGDDGCGGSCGACGKQEACIEGGCVPCNCSDDDEAERCCPVILVRAIPLPYVHNPGGECCFDFDDDPYPDNGFVWSLLDEDGQDALDGWAKETQQAIAEGRNLMVLQPIGLEADSTEAVFDMNALVVHDPDQFPGDNFEREVLEPHPDYAPAGGGDGPSCTALELKDAELRTQGSCTLWFPFREVYTGEDRLVPLRNARIEGRLEWDEGLPSLVDARIGGLIMTEDIVAIWNGYAQEHCACLHLEGALLTEDSERGGYDCAQFATPSSCSDDLCGRMFFDCDTTLDALDSLTDIVLEGGGTAMSVGAYLLTVPAYLSE